MRLSSIGQQIVLLNSNVKANKNQQNSENQNNIRFKKDYTSDVFVKQKYAPSFMGKVSCLDFFNDLGIDSSVATKVANSLKTSTSGHRSPWGSETFNKTTVKRLAASVGLYAINKAKNIPEAKPTVMIGGDTREASKECLEIIPEILSKMGVDVNVIKEPVPTPIHAYWTKKNSDKVDIAILLTASHNPWRDAGFNLVTGDGAIAPLSVNSDVANNFLKICNNEVNIGSDNLGEIKEINIFDDYSQYIKNSGLIDFENIKSSGIKIYYDGLSGTGENTLPRILSDNGIECIKINSGEHEGPNPIYENLTTLKDNVIKNEDKKGLKIGLANDGDADRFGIIDEKGNFIQPNDVILLVAHHLKNNKGKAGDIIISQTTSPLIAKWGA